MPEGETPFWEIAPLVLSIVQLLLYINGYKKYRERLVDLADDLQTRAEERYEQYKILRDRDPEFYDYYDSLPNYSVCESNIKRSKGAAFAVYGADLRRSYKLTRGFSPLSRVYVTSHVADGAPFNSANHRAITRINERSRVDDHVLQRWDAIVRTPVHIEGAASHDVRSIIDSSFKTLNSFGKGFNSAGALFGTSLFRILN